MADHLTPEKRSWNMSQIHEKDTTVEIKVRKWLFCKGYRYRKNVKTLPGKPDIVLNSYHSVIFIHGCFWHRHADCKRATMPKSKTEYWTEKFDRNVANDLKHKKDLEAMGYQVIVLWECEINKMFDETMARVVETLGQPRKSNN